jgi:drug/metabolite transporter (DMT)-like permease
LPRPPVAAAEAPDAPGGTLPRLAALTAVVFWGISFVATKAALREVSPITLIFTRFGLGVLTLLGLLALRRRPLLPPRDAWGSLLVLGFFGIFLHQVIQSYALTLTKAVHAGWLVGLIPIWTAILAAIFLGERFGPLKVAGLVLGFGGVLLVMAGGEESSSTSGPPEMRGDLLLLGSTLVWAIYTILGRGPIQRLGSGLATAGSMLVGWALLAPFFLAGAGWREYPMLSPIGWGAVLFLGIGCSGLAYLLWYAALERLEASRVASFLYVEPFVTQASAAALLAESLKVVQVLGGLLVLAAVLLVEQASKQGRK